MMKRIIVCITVTLSIVITPLNAQFNLKKLKDKAKGSESSDKKTEQADQNNNSGSTNSKSDPSNTEKGAKTTEASKQDNTPLTLDQLTIKDLSVGKYYSTNKKVEYIDISSCCSDATIKFKVKSGPISDHTYKKSSYTENLYYDPYNDNFLYIYKEKGVILYYSTESYKSGAKSYKITINNIISMDEKIKRVDPNACLEKVNEVMTSQAEKKRADEEKEEKARVEAKPTPVEKMKNPELNKQALAAMNTIAQNDKYGYQYTKVWLVSDNWEIHKNTYTGVVLYRSLEVQAVYSKDGKCFIDHFSLKQDHDGSGFQKNLVYNGVISGHEEILCSKVK